jgi:hypothetical protein
MKNLGIILIALGILMMVFTGFNIVTKKKVVDIGKLEINKEEKTPVNWSPIVGVGLLVSGILVVVLGNRSRA